MVEKTDAQKIQDKKNKEIEAKGIEDARKAENDKKAKEEAEKKRIAEAKKADEDVKKKNALIKEAEAKKAEEDAKAHKKAQEDAEKKAKEIAAGKKSKDAVGGEDAKEKRIKDQDPGYLISSLALIDKFEYEPSGLDDKLLIGTIDLDGDIHKGYFGKLYKKPYLRCSALCEELEVGVRGVLPESEFDEIHELIKKGKYDKLNRQLVKRKLFLLAHGRNAHIK